MKNIKYIARLIYYTSAILFIAYFYRENKALINESFSNKVTVNELNNYRIKIVKLSEGALGYDSSIPLTWMSKGMIKENPRAIGVCYGIYPFNMNISVKKSTWTYMSERKRLIVLAHEYLHCSCLSSHSEGVMKDGCEKSIMNPSIPSMFCINKHYTRYVNEMKRGCE